MLQRVDTMLHNAPKRHANLFCSLFFSIPFPLRHLRNQPQIISMRTTSGRALHAGITGLVFRLAGSSPRRESCCCSGSRSEHANTSVNWLSLGLFVIAQGDRQRRDKQGVKLREIERWRRLVEGTDNQMSDVMASCTGRTIAMDQPANRSSFSAT